MLNIGTISHAAGGSLFLILTILLATSWRGRLQGALVVSATLLSTAWCFALAYQAVSQAIPFTAVLVIEILRDGAWLVLLLSLLGAYDHSALTRRRLVLLVHGLWLAVLVYSVAAALGLVSITALSAQRTALILGLLILALMGLVLVEQLYRNTPTEKRWAIKFLCLGLGIIFAYDFFLYSHGLLFRQLDPDIWSARGAVNALVVPLIAVAATRNAEWAVNIFVSRQVVFYTTSLVGAGAYLLAMSLGGYYIRRYGGTWGPVAQIIFLLASAIVLFSVMFSGQVRARLKVFLAKHFYKNKYDYREEWLQLIDTLSTPSKEFTLPERTIKGIADIVNSPCGALWMVRDSNQFTPTAGWNMAVSTDAIEASNSSLASFLRDTQWVVDIDEYQRDARMYKGLTLPEWLQRWAQAWLVIPLMQEHELLAFVVLTRPDPAHKLTWEDTDLLKTVGRQIASYLAQHEAGRLLAEAKQFDAYNRLTAFIMHDLKNLIAQQSLVVKNASKHKGNPAFIADAISTIDSSVARMNRLLKQLKHGELQGPGQTINLSTLLARLIGECKSRKPVPMIEGTAEELYVYAVPEGLAMVLSHTLRNAQDATQADGYIRIHLKRASQTAVIEIEDNGCGMEAAFLRDRLFRPFDTTKGSKGMGIGAYQTREFIWAAGGNVEVDSEPGRGTCVRIMLPIVETETEQEYQQAHIRK